MKILVVDDFVANISFVRVALSRLGHAVLTARNGKQAVEMLASEPVEMIITDWMMPGMDGLGLIRQVRRMPLGRQPVMVVLTALRSHEAEAQALEAGADAFVMKPVTPTRIAELVSDVEAGKYRHGVRPSPLASALVTPTDRGIALGAGANAADAVCTVFKSLGALPDAAFFIVLHGPGWASEVLRERLGALAPGRVHLAEDGMPVSASSLYIAPGDCHLTLASDGKRIRLDAGPEENFHRPSIDPLFRSLAEVYGRRGTGIVLGGTGIDGYIGAGHIRVAHGTVIVQDPDETVASQMPKNVIALGLASRVLPLASIAGVLRNPARSAEEHSMYAASVHHFGMRA